MVKIIRCALLGLILSITGCQNVFRNNIENDAAQQEYILNKVKNYRGLIKLYRDKLNHEENSEDRYKLAKYYYQVEDYSSSRLYLQPLLATLSNEKALLLESKNLLEQGKKAKAMATVDRTLQLNPSNGEAWNLQGILLAQGGNFNGALQAFKEARTLFVDEDIVVNNLAMLEIMRENYAAARDYLAPLYYRGQISPKMLHNLVFALVKLRDFNSAENIINEQKMSSSADGLLESLVKIKPRPQQQLQRKMLLENMKSLPQQALTKKITGLTYADQPTTTTITQNLPPKATTVNNKLSIPALRIADDQTKAAITLPTMENASLTVTRRLKEISSVRFSQHPKYFRMTLESSQVINYRELDSAVKNKKVFELLNVKLTDNMLEVSKKTLREHRNIRKMTFYQKEVDIVMVEFEFEHSVAKNNIFRLAANKKNKERLVFDIYL